MEAIDQRINIRPREHDVARVAAAEKRARVGIEEHAIELEGRAIPGIEVRADRVVGAVLKNQRMNLRVGKPAFDRLDRRRERQELRPGLNGAQLRIDQPIQLDAEHEPRPRHRGDEHARHDDQAHPAMQPRHDAPQQSTEGQRLHRIMPSTAATVYGAARPHGAAFAISPTTRTARWR